MNKKRKVLTSATSQITGICVVCNKRITTEIKTARQIDGLSVCGPVCITKLLKEKKKWNAENWEALCKMQVLYEERKRGETGQPVNR